MIEGIGHERGLFEPMQMVLEFYSEFICYGENNIPLYGDPNCTLNVGTSEWKNLNPEIIVYPNPTYNKIIIERSDNKIEINSYKITDIYGKLILSKNLELSKNNEIVINLKETKSGMYFLILNLLDDKTIIRKIIKK